MNGRKWVGRLACATLCSVLVACGPGLHSVPDRPGSLSLSIMELGEDGVLEVPAGSRRDIQLVALGANGDPVEFSATGLPPYAVLEEDLLSLTPTREHEGDTQFVLTARSGELETSQDITLRVTAQPNPNVLRNATFEEGAVGEFPSEWSSQVPELFRVSDASAHEGGRALRGSGGPGTHNMNFSQKIPRELISADTRYRLSLWYLPEQFDAFTTEWGTSGPEMQVRVYSGGVELVGFHPLAPTGSATEWKQASLTFTTPEKLPEDLTVQFFVLQFAGGGDWVFWFDDVVLQRDE